MIEKIEFTNSKGELINCVLREKNPSRPLVIVCHGYKSSNEHPALVAITNKLYAMGNALFAFNFSPSKMGVDLEQQVTELTDVVAYFQGKRKIILWGGSFGALSCAIVASQSSQIAGLITTNGFFGSRHVGLKILKVYVIFKILCVFNKTYRDIWKFLQDNLNPEKIKVKTLVMHARNDKTVFMTQSEEFFRKVAGPKEFCVLEDADHDLTRESYRQEVAEVVNRWLKKFK